MHKKESVPVYALQLPELKGQSDVSSEQEVCVLSDVAVDLEVELGRTMQRIGEILEWEEGTIISLDKLAGESAEVFVNNGELAKGEVMVVDGRLAIRVVEILGPEERVGDML